MFDAEGSYEGTVCPGCGRTNTVTYRYDEGFDELECLDCGYLSDQDELAALQRYGGELLEGDGADTPPAIPFRRIKA